MAAVAVAQSESLTISRSESQAIVTVLLVTTAVTTLCAVATTVPIAVLDPVLSSTESRRGPAYDLPVAKPVAKDEVVQVAVPVYDHYAFRRLAVEQPAQLENKTAPPATSGRSVDDLFVIAYQIYALVLGLLIAYCLIFNAA